MNPQGDPLMTRSQQKALHRRLEVHQRGVRQSCRDWGRATLVRPALQTAELAAVRMAEEGTVEAFAIRSGLSAEFSYPVQRA